MIVAIALTVWIWSTENGCKLFAFLDRDGTAVYGALLASVTSLLGFAIAAMTLVSAIVLDKRFVLFRKDPFYLQFWAAFTWTVSALGAAAVCCLVAMFANQISSLRGGAIFVTALLLVMSISSLLRSGYTLRCLLNVTRDLPDEPVNTPKNEPVVP